MSQAFVYNSAVDDIVSGDIDLAWDQFRMLVVGNIYVPDKDGHAKRSDVIDEIASPNYPPKGVILTQSITKDAEGLSIQFGTVTLRNINETARGAVIYKHRGGAASQDELLVYIDFGNPVRLVGRTTLSFSPLRFNS
jgi:hypothetical protein